MPRFLLTPRWLALHVATLAAIAGTVVLGSWQMRAYDEQEQRERAAEANQQASAPARPVADVVPAGQALREDAVGVPVTITGTYDPTQTVLVAGRELDGRAGWYVLTPLVAGDGSVTPVLRGWVDAPGSAAVAAPGEEVTVRGVVQPLETDADAAVDPRASLPAGQVAAMTSVVLFQAYPYDPAEIRQARVVATTEDPAPAAAPEAVPVEQAAPRPVGISAWRHLSYAWQWWLFAAAAVVFWAAFVRAGARDERAAQAAASSAAPPAEPSHHGLP